MAQGTPWNKQKVIDALEPLLKRGFTVRRACRYAGIPQPTIATWIRKDPELQLKFNVWRGEPDIIAVDSVISNMKSNPDMSMRWLQAKVPDFMPKSKSFDSDDDIEDEENEEEILKKYENISDEALKEFADIEAKNTTDKSRGDEADAGESVI